jgi:glutamine synthetase type III
LGRILGLWTELGFLDSKENYQSSKQFANMGTMRITMENGDRKRTAEFNWSNNKQAFALVTEYRRVADQAVFVFDVSVARENQPLDTPKLMDELESMLKRADLSDPLQLVPLLTDLRTDEHVPLITRNHADRLLKKIEK